MLTQRFRRTLTTRVDQWAWPTVALALLVAVVFSLNALQGDGRAFIGCYIVAHPDSAITSGDTLQLVARDDPGSRARAIWRGDTLPEWLATSTWSPVRPDAVRVWTSVGGHGRSSILLARVGEAWTGEVHTYFDVVGERTPSRPVDVTRIACPEPAASAP